MKTELGGQVSPAGPVLQTPTPFPTIGPTPDLEATKSAIEAIDAFRRASDEATRTAVEAQATAEQYARRPGGHPRGRASHPNTYGHSNCNTNGDTHRYAGAHGYSNADTHADPHANASPCNLLPGVGGLGAGVDQAGEQLPGL